MKRFILRFIKLFCLIALVAGAVTASQSPLQAAQVPAPTLRLVAPPGAQSPTAPTHVQVQVENGQDLSGFEFDLIYDPDLVEVVGLSAGSFLGAGGDCDPNNTRCAVTLGPVTQSYGTSLGGSSYGGGSGASGNGLLATIHLQPTGRSGSTSLQLANPLLATANPALAVTPLTIPATLNLGEGGSGGAETIYLPLILKGGQLAASTSETAMTPALAPLPTVQGAANGPSPDTDADGQVNVVDLARVASIWGATPASGGWNANFDLSGNQVIDKADLDLVVTRWKIGLTKIVRTSPLDGEPDVAVTRETVIEFSDPLDPATVNGAITARFGSQPLNSRLHLSPDNRRVTLFYNPPLPASATIEVTIDGSQVRDANGFPVDLSGDGFAGNRRTLDFETLSLTMVPGTSVCGQVYASERAAGSTSDVPLEGATITVDGMESTLQTTTDATGRFCLDPAPAGRFFAHVDGRTATNNVPAGAYYPYVGKPWHARPGIQTEVGDVYLPLVQPGTLQPVSASQDTTINFAPSVIADNPDFAEVRITVPADSLFADNGNRGGQVGIAPVPPDRLPGQLPDGLEFPVVITVQTDGPTNFDTPAPVCFPNLPDPVSGETSAPGAKEALFSFNHDSGQWEAAGSMTVNAEGTLVCSDPGVGIRAPGWHGTGPNPYGPPQPQPPSPCNPQNSASLSGQQTACDDDDTPQCPAPNAGPTVDWRGYLSCIPPQCDPGLLITCDEVVNANQNEREAWCRRNRHQSFTANQYPRRGENFYNYCMRRARTISIEETLLCGEKFDNCQNANRNLLISPANATVEQIDAIFDQIGDLLAPYGYGETPPQPIRDQIDNLLAEADAAAGGSVDQYLTEQITAAERDVAAKLSQIGWDRPAPTLGSHEGYAPGYPIRYLAEISRADGSLLELRGQTAAYGQYSVFVPRNSQLRRVSFYDPQTKGLGSVQPLLSVDSAVSLPYPILLQVDDSYLDSDGDNLVDIAEFIYGTDPDNPDTDGDGVSDGAEVEQGTNPLDGFIVDTGVIGGVDTPGFAYDLCIENDLAVIADGTAGISLVDVADPFNPVIVGQLDTPGEAVDVACTGQRAVVADYHGGMLLVDISDPTAPQLVRQIGRDATLRNPAMAVEGYGDLAYFDLSSFVFGQDNGLLGTLDAQSGQLQGMLGTGRGNKNLSVVGQQLVGLDPSEISVFDVAGGQPTLLGKTAHNRSPYNGQSVLSQVFNTGPLVYMSHFDGYDTLDLTDPRQPAVLGRSTEVVGTYRGIAENGSGLLLAAYSRGPNDWALGLFDSSDPTNTDQLLTEFPMPPGAYKVVIDKGLAYIANGDNGLQVVNYLSPDTAGSPPAVSVGLGAEALPGVAPANQPVSLIATVDDVQVRQVDFFVDDQLIDSDGSYPFQARFTTPTLANQSSLTLRARATDTGGNVGWSEETTLTLVADGMPPQVERTTPPDGSRLPAGRPLTLAATFSEAIDPASLTPATFRFLDGNGTSLNGGTVSYDAATRTATLTLNQSLALGDYRATLTTGIRDAAGNPLAAEVTWSFSVATPVRWDGGGDGVTWNNAANWDTNIRPGSDDLVVIESSDPLTVNVSSPGTIYSLHSDAALNFQQGTLEVAGASEINGAVTLDGSTRLGGTGEVVINGPVTWRAAEMFGPAKTTVTDQLAFDGAGDKSLSNQRTLEIGGTAIWRDGRILRGGSGQPAEVSIHVRPGATFDIQSDQTMLGTNILFHNEGTVVKSAGSGATTINATFSNAGLLQVQSGRLAFSNDFIQTESGTLAVRLGGLTPQTEFDQITVANLVALRGTLDVSLTNGFTPAAGDRFEIVTFGGYLGQFDTINGNGRSYTAEYGPNGVTLVSQN